MTRLIFFPTYDRDQSLLTSAATFIVGGAAATGVAGASNFLSGSMAGPAVMATGPVAGSLGANSRTEPVRFTGEPPVLPDV